MIFIPEDIPEIEKIAKHNFKNGIIIRDMGRRIELLKLNSENPNLLISGETILNNDYLLWRAKKILGTRDYSEELIISDLVKPENNIRLEVIRLNKLLKHYKNTARENLRGMRNEGYNTYESYRENGFQMKRTILTLRLDYLSKEDAIFVIKGIYNELRILLEISGKTGIHLILIVKAPFYTKPSPIALDEFKSIIKTFIQDEIYMYFFMKGYIIKIIKNDITVNREEIKYYVDNILK